MVHIEESLQLPRDFEGKTSLTSKCNLGSHTFCKILTDLYLGFGEEGYDPKWPNGARIAISFVLNYE
jgi:hypothetical protein